MITWLKDSFTNLVAELGTDRDKASHGSYTTVILSDAQLSDAYRGSWIPRKIVDIPAKDATRRWRAWQADKKQISAIEAEEKRLGLQQKVRDAMIKARLFGGAGIYIGIKGDRDPSLPLDPARVQKGGIEFLTVLPRRVLTVHTMQNDPGLPGYGQPSEYQISSPQLGQLFVHPSRIVRFLGDAVPDEELDAAAQHGWGDSVLQAAYEACKNADSAMANTASLIYEAKIDVLGVPGLADIMADPSARKLFVDRAQLAAMLKSNNGMFIRDAEETYDSKSFSFTNLDNLIDRFLQVAAGAADIPITRLLGQSPGGLNATGDSDIRNYYDRVQAMQELDIGPALEILDKCLVRSALGAHPENVWYIWRSLWQPTEKERIDNGKTLADTVKILADAQVMPPDVLGVAAENALIEYGVLPGLENAREKFDEEGDPDADDV